MKTTQTRRLVLYADDDADDRMLLADVLQNLAPEVQIEPVHDGYAALEYLNERCSQLPSLLILDLNMPGLNGKEVLRKLKSDTRFESLPIVVFTTSANPSDIQECARFGVDLITKPINLHEFEEAAVRLISYCQ